MKKQRIQNIAIVFGKREDGTFDRFTFPILGRPAAAYPLLAALFTEKIETVYLSSDSISLLQIGENLKRVELLVRKQSQSTFTEEIRVAVQRVIDQLGYVPRNVALLLANSPCINPSLLDYAFNYLEDHPEYDSVVTTMKRAEFSPRRIFSLNENHHLLRQKYDGNLTEDVYFLDRRVMVVRIETILNSKSRNDYFESTLGSTIHPIIQQDGIWDIDYSWQVPIVERWLQQNGFSETKTPYAHQNTSKVSSTRNEKFGTANGDNGKTVSRILITTVPFGQIDPGVIQLLKSSPNVEYVINPIGRKLKEHELCELIKDYDIVIAGTEPITRKVIQNASRLKLISRVGIGLDSVDLIAAKEHGVAVSYTPDAPAPAVAELTIGHMLNLLRFLPLVDRKIRDGVWHRIHGDRLMNMIIGVIGTGRVGSRVLRHLQGFSPQKILVNDLNPDFNLYEMYSAEYVSKETIYKEADIITLHVPLTSLTKNLITKKQITLMKRTVCLINTSRGGIIHEGDLYNALAKHRIAGAAIDVFENEPYTGNLTELDNCFLSCHMGSMTKDCRAQMERQATEEALRFVNNEPLVRIVNADDTESNNGNSKKAIINVVPAYY